MKPWEEMWTAEGFWLLCDGENGGLPSYAHAILGTEERAKLAAQAPAMARLLYRLWQDEEDEGRGAPSHWTKILRAAGVIDTEKEAALDTP